MRDSPIDLDIKGPNSSVKSVNDWTIYTGFLFIKVKANVLDEMITEEWYTNVSQILPNNIPQILKKDIFFLLHQLPYQN